MANKVLPDVIPPRMLAIPKVAKLAAALARAETAARDTQLARNRAEAEGLPPAPEPFDESAAAQRIARAKARDVVHGTKDEAAEIAAVAADRKAVTKVSADAAAVSTAAADRLLAIQRADDAADVMVSDIAGQLQMALVESAAELLPALHADYLQEAAKLHKFSVELYEIACAADPSMRARRPPETVVPLGLRGNAAIAAAEAAGAYVGSHNATPTAVFGPHR